MKWFLIASAALLLAAIMYFTRFSTKTEYVNGLPEYTALPGTEYIFERDCYIFKFKNRDTQWPLIGANAPTLPGRVPELPLEVTEKNVGANFRDVRILDVARSGARFKIVSVRRDRHRGQATVTFEILFLDENERRYPRLDAFCLLDHSLEQSGQAPRIIEDYAVPRVKK